MAKLIPLSKKMHAIVDDEDYESLVKYNWWTSKGGNGLDYATRYLKGNTELQMHREIMNAPKGWEVDHIDGNGLNNQRLNLRVATHENNSRNRLKRKESGSKYKGVYWHKRDSRWYAGICVSYKKIHIGSYTIEEDAARAYDAAARHHFGDFARTNFND